MNLPQWSVYALRYATVQRRAGENFIAPDPHDQPGVMDYYVWAIVSGDECLVVDTGFDERAARQRGRTLLRHPVEALRGLGIDAASVTDVIVTHLHYDHAGNLDSFPAATFHLQQAEMAFACGPCMCEPFLRHPFEVEDVVAMVRKVYAGRVRFHDGDADLRPGISLHRIGGHTDGLQAVRVHTARGWVVLASDAAHYTANLRRRSPFPIVYHVGDMLRGFDRVVSLADSPDHVIPGHDPLVLARYPQHQSNPEIVQLHHTPAAS